MKLLFINDKFDFCLPNFIFLKNSFYLFYFRSFFLLRLNLSKFLFQLHTNFSNIFQSSYFRILSNCSENFRFRFFHNFFLTKKNEKEKEEKKKEKIKKDKHKERETEIDLKNSHYNQTNYPTIKEPIQQSIIKLIIKL